MVLNFWGTSACARSSRPPRPRASSPKLNANQFTAARAALDAGQAVEQVAAAFGVSRATLYRNLAEPADQQ
jgi:hypothetical protein